MKLHCDINLSQFSTFKIGGSAKYFCALQNKEDAVRAAEMAKELKVPYFVFGAGSNILFSDSGFNGLAARYYCDKDVFRLVSFNKNYVVLDAGVPLGLAVKLSSEAGMAGLEWAAGIPGTIGGAINGNSQAYGGEISQIVENVELFCDGRRFTLGNKEMKFGYRDSICKRKPLIILSACLKFKKTDPELIKSEIARILKKRDESGRNQYPSAGCVFKNPSIEDAALLDLFKKERKAEIAGGKIPAGFLIEKAGLKGREIGGAMISRKHANFIINIGKAKAQDVLDLIEFIKRKVYNKFGVMLEEEIVKNEFSRDFER